MNPRSTRILLVLALVMFAFIMGVERRSPGPATAPAGGPLLPNFERDAVTTLEFIYPSNQVLRIERRNGGWEMRSPEVYPVQAASVDAFLESLGSLKRRVVMTGEELRAQGGGAQSYGLSPPRMTLRVGQGDRITELLVGNPAPMAALFYYQRAGETAVWASEATFLARLPATPQAWRSRLLLDVAGLSYDGLRVRSGALGFELERDATNKTWRLTKPLAMKANHSKVESLLQVLQTMEVTDFVTGPGAAVNLDVYGMQPAKTELLFSRGTNDLLSLRLGTSPTNQPGLIYARVSALSNVVTVTRQVADLLALPYTEFIDPQLVFFPTNAVDRVEIRSAEAIALERQTNGSWRVTSPAALAADSDLVQLLFDEVLRLEILEVEKDVVTELDFPRYGFTTNSPRLSFYGSATNASGLVTNRLLAEAEFGSNHVDRIFVRRAGDTPVFVTRLGDVRRLPTRGFEFREQRIWTFASNDVTGVTIRSKGQTVKLARTPEWAWSIVSGGPTAPPLALDESLFRWGQLEAERWADRGAAALGRYRIDDGASELTVEWKREGKPFSGTLRFGSRAPSLGPYSAVVLPGDAEPSVFWFRYWHYDPYAQVLKELKLAD